MSRTPKLDVPMDTTLSMRTTKRAANTFRERAAARHMSLGEYLDYLTTRSAIVNDLAPTGDDTLAVRTPDAPQMHPEPATEKREDDPRAGLGPDTCHLTNQPHRAGGFGSTGMIQRCQDCGMRKVSGRWTGILPTNE